jgi:hypothetical protein
MRFSIEADSQEEFDEKRPELLKAIAGNRLEVEIREKGQRKAMEQRPQFYRAQEEIFDHWDSKFQAMILDIKREIADVLS